MEHVITVEDMRQMHTRLSKVWKFVFPHAEEWEEETDVAFHSRTGAFRIGFNFPRYARPDGCTFPHGPDGYLFMGATMRLYDWDDVLLFAEWIEKVQALRMVSYK